MRMIASIAVAACLMLFAVRSMADDAGNAPKAPAADLQLQLQLPDGNQWTLGTGGVGRPFMARLLLTNTGKKPVRVWYPSDPEGTQCPYVTLTDAKGAVTTLTPPPGIRLAGVPGVEVIQPAQVVPIELELLRLIGEHSLPPGKYKVQAFYANTLKDERPFVTEPVWTGKIQSAAMDITIVPPKVALTPISGQ